MLISGNTFFILRWNNYIHTCWNWWLRSQRYTRKRDGR